jgi:hypothetical protein
MSFLTASDVRQGGQHVQGRRLEAQQNCNKTTVNSAGAPPHDRSVDCTEIAEQEDSIRLLAPSLNLGTEQLESPTLPSTLDNATLAGRDGGRTAYTDEDMDVITDTVGAIAVDLHGNIAAGSSSGGIGMKHSGRIGPAALVGIGTAVIPEDPDDEDQTSVAAVTSGTGEHMATSIASAKCAERLFHSSRRGPGGKNIEEFDDHAIMDAFIVDDFMGHPGVRNQTSPGAIGVMAAKKTRGAVYFYFAHNTDSFALASMASTEREPSCVMSRLGQSREVAQGARKIVLG